MLAVNPPRQEKKSHTVTFVCRTLLISLHNTELCIIIFKIISWDNFRCTQHLVYPSYAIIFFLFYKSNKFIKKHKGYNSSTQKVYRRKHSANQAKNMYSISLHSKTKRILIGLLCKMKILHKENLKTIHEEGDHPKAVNFQAGFSCSSLILWFLQRMNN